MIEAILENHDATLLLGVALIVAVTVHGGVIFDIIKKLLRIPTGAKISGNNEMKKELDVVGSYIKEALTNMTRDIIKDQENLKSRMDGLEKTVREQTSILGEIQKDLAVLRTHYEHTEKDINACRSKHKNK